MLGLLAALALGVGIGLVRGGSLRRLEQANLHALPVVFAGVLLQVLATVSGDGWDGTLGLVLVLAAFGAFAVFALANRHEIGMPLIAMGAACNFAVIAVNGAMPVSGAALREVGLRLSASSARGGHELLTDSSRLTFLADIIPLHLGNNVVSAGDLLIWAGMALLLQHLMVGRGRHAATI